MTESTIDAANSILQLAITKRASDIHIETDAQQGCIRMRIDGYLQTIKAINLVHAENLIARYKVLAKLDVTERRLPQDSQFDFIDSELTANIRLSTCPTLHGEKLVLRIITMDKNRLQLNELGFTEEQLQLCQAYLNRPTGLILVTGPTGSGKTVTLYAMLQYLNTGEKNIVTIEDPIEVDLPGINQTNINPKLGFSFIEALRAILRQDPDIIMIGEIRDEATAKIALHAANTGHLVLATLHCNQAQAAFRRLKNLNLALDDLCQSVSLVIAQRLIRRLHNSGYFGRIGTYEILAPPKNQYYETLADFEKDLSLCVYPTLADTALLKVQEGITDYHEIKMLLKTGAG